MLIGEYKNDKQNQNKLSDLKKAEKNWKENKYQKTVDRFGLRKDKFSFDSDKEVKALYTPLDLKNIDYQKDISFPGEFPYTRGVYPIM